MASARSPGRSCSPAIATLTGCGGGSESSRIAAIEIRSDATSVVVGDTLRLAATPRDASGNELSKRTVTWASSDQAVAMVSSDGLVTAIGPGTARLTAIVENTSGSVVLEVREKPSVAIPARDLRILELDPEGRLGAAHDVNNHGRVVGYIRTSSGSERAFLWSAEQGLTELGTLGGRSSVARAVNDRDQVVGDSETASGEVHAFLWTRERGMRDLGIRGSAYDINEHGQVVGIEGQTAFLWTETGAIRSLGALGEGHSVAYGINNLGQIVGSTRVPSGRVHAFLWTEQRGMRDLGALDGVFSEALAINDLGQVVGHSGTAARTGESHAFIWTEAGGMRNLNIQVPGGGSAFANDINERGQVAGGFRGLRHRAFVWSEAEGAVELAPLPERSYSFGFRINDRGEAAGESGDLGVRNSSIPRAVLWTGPRK